MTYDELIESLETIKVGLRDEASRLRVASLQVEIDKRNAYTEGFRAGARAAYEKAAQYMDSLDGVVDSEDIAIAIRNMEVPEMTPTGAIGGRPSGQPRWRQRCWRFGRTWPLG